MFTIKHKHEMSSPMYGQLSNFRRLSLFKRRVYAKITTDHALNHKVTKDMNRSGGFTMLTRVGEARTILAPPRMQSAG